MHRKILSIENTRVRINDKFDVDIKTVLFVFVKGETSRTYKTDHIELITYINRKYQGFATFINRKGISINKRNPMLSSSLQGVHLDKLKDMSLNDALLNYLETLQNLAGTVTYFNRDTGCGAIHIDTLDMSMSVYACNLRGNKTWYAETACTYLDDKQAVKIDRLARVYPGLTCVVSEGVKFDQEKWNSLDQSRLAFKCDEDGNAINGLFA